MNRSAMMKGEYEHYASHDPKQRKSTMTTANIELPTVVTRAEWLVARKQLLTKEKELTRRKTR